MGNTRWVRAQINTSAVTTDRNISSSSCYFFLLLLQVLWLPDCFLFGSMFQTNNKNNELHQKTKQTSLISVKSCHLSAVTVFFMCVDVRLSLVRQHQQTCVLPNCFVPILAACLFFVPKPHSILNFDLFFQHICVKIGMCSF